MAAQKKSLIASERDEEVRGLWRWLASHFDARRLVFVDESGFHTSMTRLRARAPKGKRAYGKVPRNRGKNTTLIAAITLEGAIGESMSVEGATDSEAFEAYVEHFLAPTLDEYCVVCKVERGPSESSPPKGASNGPTRAYSTVGPPGRGRNRFVLPSGRHLLPAQPQREKLRDPQRALRFGGHNPRPLPTA